MIVDFYEALDVLATAVAVWIVIGVAAVTAFGYGLAALVWCAWTTVRRGVAAAAAWRGLRKAQAPAGGAQRGSGGFGDAGDAPSASQGPSNPAPPFGQVGRKAA